MATRYGHEQRNARSGYLGTGAVCPGGIGGNQVAVFTFEQAAEVLLYDTRDPECTGEPVGGPFAVSGATGSRSVLVLYGQPNEMAGLVLDV